MRKGGKRVLDIYLVRHAESEMQTKPHLICGRYPHTPLTERGREEARLLGERFAREKRRFDEICISPTIRVYQTLDILRQFIGSEDSLVITDALHEIHRGEMWDGKERNLLFEADPDVSARADRHGVDFCLPGGETMREVGMRMMQWAMEQVALHQKTPYSILAGSHCVAINCLVWALFGKKDAFALHPKIENTSITHIRYTGRWMLMALNDHAHLLPATIADRNA